ncbi:ABC transporter substrate-binding protein [Bradyrhizobium zhanjiangense]|uniref:ABC transporter substrate-binding protein n=1 Tax=Bradyrhizobium zhanjiangense TaxID=1325107 RepID=UPI0013E8C40E|nr:ABC transporter substrate-binding protein [Bradyrhizobium zhanjiangense]
MSKKDHEDYAVSALSRRSLLQSTVGALSVPFVAKATAASAQERLAGSGQVVVYSYGGSFTAGLRKYVFDPFTKATGITVVDVTADDADPQVKAMHQAGRVDWDTAFVKPSSMPSMRKAGLFESIDYSWWDADALEGVPEKARLTDSVLAYESCMLLAYDERAFKEGGPKNWADFWDVKKFPGPRGLYALVPTYNISSALFADGVAASDIWPMTDDKVERGLKKLDEIKPYVTKWWTSGGESTQLLINNEYVMTSAFDGRAISAILQGAPIRMVWGGASGVYSPWVVLKGGPNTKNAQKLTAFLNRAEVAAGFMQGTGYPGPNLNQLRYLPEKLRKLVSVNPENAANVVVQDDNWLSSSRPDGKTNQEHITERWLAWRAQ